MKDTLIKARVTTAEHAVIRRHAVAAGMTVSAYLRWAALRPDPILKRRQWEAFQDALDQLRGAAVNLNQLAYQVNRRSGSLPDTETLEEISAHLTLFAGLAETFRVIVRSAEE